MKYDRTTLLLEAGTGFVTGMRSLSMPTVLSNYLLEGTADKDLKKLLGKRFLSLLFAGELTADKTPFVPDRTDPPSLLGRIAIAAICGSVVAHRRNSSLLKGALISAIAAATSTHIVFRARKKAGKLTRLPSPVLGFVEDAIVLTAAYKIGRKVKG